MHSLDPKSNQTLLQVCDDTLAKQVRGTRSSIRAQRATLRSLPLPTPPDKREREAMLRAELASTEAWLAEWTSRLEEFRETPSYELYCELMSRRIKRDVG